MTIKGVKGRTAPKRLYLAKDERHTALLDIAATVVEKHGWQALSMISVAEQAKVSRQLIYAHFSSVNELMTETMSHIFRDIYERVREGIKQSRGNIASLSLFAENTVFDLSPGRARALGQMIAATHAGNTETSRMSRRLRHLLTNMWMPIMTEVFGLPEREGRVMIWMLHMAFWGAHQLVHEGEVDRETVTRLFTCMTAQIQAGTVMAPLKTKSPRK